ncbi:Aldedh domain-containing protein [Forsythia ovata]|uniref:Aldedh domain-containing protein n=1 Tax=Forsythia ovata TaxID=205694 RepID=A0ABD1VLD6_9LAMI
MGRKILTCGNVTESEGNFVQPTIVEIFQNADVVKEELFGQVLYVMKFQLDLFFAACSTFLALAYNTASGIHGGLSFWSRGLGIATVEVVQSSTYRSVTSKFFKGMELWGRHTVRQDLEWNN